MNFNWIIADILRNQGHSTAAVGAAKPDWVVCVNYRQSKQLSKEHGVQTQTLQQGENGSFQNRPGSVVFDTAAVQVIVASYEQKLADLREQLTSAQRILA